jgi:sporulation protein YlmC with PRC-barrel domain
MRTSKLKGLPVLGIDDGVRVGVVDDLLIDTRERRVAALVLRTQTVNQWIPFDRLQRVGDDAVMVASAQVVQQASEQSPLGALPSLRALLGLEVLDAAGKRWGRLEELDIDPADGRITELAVRRSGVLGLGGGTERVPATALRSLGPDVVVVEARPAPPEARAPAGDP